MGRVFKDRGQTSRTILPRNCTEGKDLIPEFNFLIAAEEKSSSASPVGEGMAVSSADTRFFAGGATLFIAFRQLPHESGVIMRLFPLERDASSCRPSIAEKQVSRTHVAAAASSQPVTCRSRLAKCRTVAYSSSAENGLARQPSMPDARKRSRSPTMALAERETIVVLFRWLLLSRERIWRTASTPSMMGIWSSIR